MHCLRVCLVLLMLGAAGEVLAQEGPLRGRLLARRAQNIPASPEAEHLKQQAALLVGVVSPTAAGFAEHDARRLTAVAEAIDTAASALTSFDEDAAPTSILADVQVLLQTKAAVDRQLEAALALRGGFASLDDGPQRRAALLGYLRATAQLIDLASRLRYTLFDALNAAAFELAPHPVAREQLVDLLLARESSIGAAVMAAVLVDPPPGMGYPAPAGLKFKVLRLIAQSRAVDQVPQVAEMIRAPNIPPNLLLAAAETIYAINLPQDAMPGQDPTFPQPAITAKELHQRLSHVDRRRWQPAETPRLDALLAWLAERRDCGATDDRCRLGDGEIQPGDWLLMRNPSPYNLFTDLSPGLFTHVGVVAAHTPSDGIRRIVLVDLPERGTHIPATNVDAFVQRTRHYVFLRHPDPEVARRMGEAAASMIGNPAQFDLNFRTQRVEELRDQDLAGRKIHTYCAGFLLLCAQASGAPRNDFFPIPEAPAGGKTIENLAQLGLTFGDRFISPTGALFSQKLQIVGRREPMYDPRREVEEAIFDHFAQSLVDETLTPSPDLFQSLRTRLAEMSQANPLLARALAAASNVNHEMDLVSAARAAAVVETLDEVAYRNSGEFLAARSAIIEGSRRPASAAPLTAEQLAQISALRQRHARLTDLWEAGELTPCELRVALVRYYAQRGREQLDSRFFSRQDAQSTADSR